MSSEALSHDDAIGQFCGVTGADEERAKGLLEACDWNLELAINMHVDTDDGRASRKPSTSNSAAGPSTSFSTEPIVTIPDSMDEDDEDILDIEQVPRTDARSTSSEEPRFRARARQTARRTGPTTAQLFPEAPKSDTDDVRPPIPPIRQVLLPNPPGYTSPSQALSGRRYPRLGATEVYDAFRDFQAEAQWQEMAQAAAVAEGESANSESSASTSLSNANKRTLQELFRPPLEIMFRGSLASAREAGSTQNKWLLVNVQNGREFACQTLNRDVWSNQTVKDILKEHFIFWQVYHDSFEGARFGQFYKVISFPHVSIIDPRTGEQMKTWPTTIDHNSFCDSVIEFLAEHPTPDGSNAANTMKKLRVKEEDAARTLYDQSEEAQLEAAIKASLQETENSNSSKAFVDEDSYTDVIESDTDQTQSSFQAHTSSNSSSTFGRANENRATSNGQSSSSATAKIVKAEFCGIGKSSSKTNLNSATTTTNNNTFSEDNSSIATEIIPEVETQEEVEDYKQYLGTDTEKFSDLVVRFPDGTRDKFKFPSDSYIKALFLLLSSRGYGMNQYNYVTTFPRRLLHTLPSTDTLQDAKLIRETIFVERRVGDDK